MSRRTEATAIEDLRRKRHERDPRISKLAHLRSASLETLDRLRDILPTLGPQRLIRINIREQPLNFRKYQLIRQRIVIRYARRKLVPRQHLRQRRTIIITRTRLFRALNRDTYLHTFITRVLRKVSRFSRRYQNIPILQSTFAIQNDPTRQHTIAIEMVVHHQINALCENIRPWRSYEIQRDLRRRISLQFRRRFVTFPMREMNAVRDHAVN